MVRDLLTALAPYWHKEAGATEAQIARLEQAVRFALPDDYKTFLRWSDGGEGELGARYLSLWPSTELTQLNEDYRIGSYLPSILAIGSDGGGKCFALDYRAAAGQPSLVQVPFAVLTPEYITVIGRTFRDGVERALRGRQG